MPNAHLISLLPSSGSGPRNSLAAVFSAAAVPSHCVWSAGASAFTPISELSHPIVPAPIAAMSISPAAAQLATTAFNTAAWAAQLWWLST